MFQLDKARRELGVERLRIARALDYLKAADRYRDEAELRILIKQVTKELTR